MIFYQFSQSNSFMIFIVPHHGDQCMIMSNQF